MSASFRTHSCTARCGPIELDVFSHRSRTSGSDRPSQKCVETCARGGGTHGDVLNVHTEAFWMYTRRRRGEGGGRRQFCLPKFAHVELSRAPEVHQRNPWISPILGLRAGRTRHVQDSSTHSLYLNTLLSSSYPEGKCAGNQL